MCWNSKVPSFFFHTSESNYCILTFKESELISLYFVIKTQPTFEEKTSILMKGVVSETHRLERWVGYHLGFMFPW